MDKLINYARLEQLVADFEAFLKENKLDADEQKLLMDIMRDRREQALNKIRASDMAMNMPFGSLFKKVARHQQNPEETE